MLRRWCQFLQIDRTFLVLVFLLCYLLVIYNRVSSGMLSWYTFTPEGPVAEFIAALIIFSLVRMSLQRFSLAPDGVTHQLQPVAPPSVATYAMAAASTVVLYLLFYNGLGLAIAALFGNIDRNFSQLQVLQGNLQAFINVILFGGLYLAYTHSRSLNQYRMALREAQQQHEQQLAQAHIRQLKAQLNPHFVFNSLNTLDELMVLDVERASGFLHDFADIYRQALQHTGDALVSLAQEIEFGRKYFALMQARLGPHYQLEWHVDDEQVEGLCLPPFSLQILLENALVHNQANVDNPLVIHVYLQNNELIVDNMIQAHRTPKQQHNGTALANLSQQCLHMCGYPVQVVAGPERFRVRVPLVSQSPTEVS